MPPYQAVTSKAQSRKLFALAGQGKLSLDEAKGKTRAADWEELPQRTSATGTNARASRRSQARRPRR